jgi:hypothetical protein
MSKVIEIPETVSPKPIFRQGNNHNTASIFVLVTESPDIASVPLSISLHEIPV